MTTVASEAPLTRSLRLPRRMAPTDATFWYAEGALPTLRPMVAGLFLLDRAPDWEFADAVFEAALALIPRLRQRVVEVPLQLGLPEWVEDPRFEQARHSRRLSLPAPGTRRQLLDLLATLFATPLDRERPLWEACWVEGLEGGRYALFLKLHQALLDGVGALGLVNALTQRNREGEPLRLSLPAAAWPERSQRGSLRRVVDVAVDNARHSAGLSWRAARAPLRLAIHPQDAASRVRGTVRGLGHFARELMRPRVVDPLARPASGLCRRFDLLELPLERLARLEATLGVGLQDLILTALAGALGAYHRERRVRVPRLDCLVPMPLGAEAAHGPDGRRLAAVRISLPVGERRPERRLRLVSEQTEALQSDWSRAALPFLLPSLALLPGLAYRWIAREVLGNANVCCASLPGFSERRFLAGAEIEAMVPFVSMVEGLPLALAVLSYAGKAELGIDTDPGAIPDPDRIGAFFASSLEEMAALSWRAAPRRRRRTARRAAKPARAPAGIPSA